MATIPTITTSTSPVTIQSSYGSGSVTYPQILQQLGSYNFKINKLTIIANNFADIQVPIIFQKVDANGNTISKPTVIVPSIYQAVTQVDVDLSNEGLVFDAQTFMNVNVNPNASLTYLFDTEQESNTNLIHSK